MIDILYRKACGYTVDETTREYAVDEEGNAKLIRQKVQTKEVPPDISALKAYLELKNDEISAMSDRELQEEKEKLIKELLNKK